MTKLLTPLAVALAGVTAGSVGMAVHAVIADPVLAWMFSGAAVMLDVFKYAAWPVAATLVAAKRLSLAVCLTACAVTFAGVSGWATYDRLVGAVEGRSAGSEQRLADLEKTQQLAAQRLTVLDAQLEDTRRQAESLRARGVITKAQELEEGALARADGERSSAVAQLEATSKERQQILAGRGTKLPSTLINLLGIGFALALEVVPVLIFLVGVGPRRRTEEAELPAQQDHNPTELPAIQEPVFMGNSLTQEPVNTGEPAAISAGPAKPATASPSLPPALGGRDEELLRALLAQGGDLMKVKEFAKAQGIGNTRASAVYKAAEVAGHITKTAAGYVRT